MGQTFTGGELAVDTTLCDYSIGIAMRFFLYRLFFVIWKIKQIVFFSFSVRSTILLACYLSGNIVELTFNSSEDFISGSVLSDLVWKYKKKKKSKKKKKNSQFCKFPKLFLFFF